MRGVVKDLGLDVEGDAVRELVAFHVLRVIGRPAPVEQPTDAGVFEGPPLLPADF